MRSRALESDGERRYVIVFDSGEEVSEGLLRFAREQDITGASFTAIGAFRRAKLAYFDVETKEYEEIPVEEQVEVLTLAGNIGVHEGVPKVHAHVVVGRRDGTTRGGHLLDAHVRPTLEVVLVEAPDRLRREIDRETGLPLLSLR